MFARKRRWEGYAGPRSTAVGKAVKAALVRSGRAVDVQRRRPHVMYDNEHETLVYTAGGVQISLFHVTADPVTRVVYSVLGRPEQLTPITLISVTYDANEHALLVDVLSEIDHRFDRPWEIGHSPRFRRAVGLRALNTAKWRKALAERPTAHATSS
ncbi:hypothetical protein [Citricoccus sp.]|uniref:hypothetical protein n=1 Tax=Citricoccus sp. TaxID=1978372 RepID=UPI0028BEAB5B|nr:hypothetical protein [Citricoccus sp.]